MSFNYSPPNLTVSFEFEPTVRASPLELTKGGVNLNSGLDFSARELNFSAVGTRPPCPRNQRAANKTDSFSESAGSQSPPREELLAWLAQEALAQPVSREKLLDALVGNVAEDILVHYRAGRYDAVSTILNQITMTSFSESTDPNIGSSPPEASAAGELGLQNENRTSDRSLSPPVFKVPTREGSPFDFSSEVLRTHENWALRHRK